MNARTHRCAARIWSGSHDRPCGKRAKVERDGMWYCGRHDPQARHARYERSDAIAAAKREIDERGWEIARLRDDLADWAIKILCAPGWSGPAERVRRELPNDWVAAQDKLKELRSAEARREGACAKLAELRRGAGQLPGGAGAASQGAGRGGAS